MQVVNLGLHPELFAVSTSVASQQQNHTEEVRSVKMLLQQETNREDIQHISALAKCRNIGENKSVLHD